MVIVAELSLSSKISCKSPRPRYIDFMSTIDFKSKRTDKVKARKLVAEIVSITPSNVSFSGHALKELTNDGLTTVDALNVLKSSDSRIHDEGELVNGSYR